MTLDAVEEKRKSVVRHVRMSAEEDALFAAFCEKTGVTFSEGMRRLAREAAMLGPTFTGDARAEIVALTRQIRAIGVNLNQAVHHMNAGNVVQGESVREWLAQAREAIIDLDALYRSLCGRAHRRAVAAVREPAA